MWPAFLAAEMIRLIAAEIFCSFGKREFIVGHFPVGPGESAADGWERERET